MDCEDSDCTAEEAACLPKRQQRDLPTSSEDVPANLGTQTADFGQFEGACMVYVSLSSLAIRMAMSRRSHLNCNVDERAALTGHFASIIPES